MPRYLPFLRFVAPASVVALMFSGWVAGCASGGESDGSLLPPGSGGASDAGIDGFSGAAGVGGTGGAAGLGGTPGSGGSGGSEPFQTTGVQCAQCQEDSDCQTGLLCVVDSAGRKFCAVDCTTFSCEKSWECVALDDYESLPSSPDAGQSDASPSDASAADGGATDASASDASSQSSGHHGRKACVPPNGKPCPCDSTTEGFHRTCFSTNGQGTCTGRETCTNGNWVGCDAPVPGPETCDGVDNNCDGLTDEQDTTLTGDQLCSDTGTPPSHSVWICEQAKCKLGPCEDGWAAYPDSLPASAGCACHVDEADSGGKSNNTCATATNLGTVKDDGKSSLTVVGTISSDSDEDWYSFHGVDVNEKPAFNHYRVHVGFTADGNTNQEFRIDVYRDKDAAKVCSAAKPGKAITSYDWCANSTTNPKQPADDDQSAYYRFRVYRAPGVPPTCKRYKVQITNYGSGACPTADACGS